MLILYGDGEHDDTAALQALLSGHDVMRPDGTVMRYADHGGPWPAMWKHTTEYHLRGLKFGPGSL